ncbi:Imm10 family immunity protein [Amycolatopsis halotolerans]|uniref:Imm10 family immunity protein n=1 Tax=Amycolatopsis halotolerans TaxID=330083 RepID=A0ABV7QAU1_9PSEU
MPVGEVGQDHLVVLVGEGGRWFGGFDDPAEARMRMARSTVVQLDEESKILTIGFSEEADGSGRSLLIQRQLGEFSQQDVELGHDTYCLMTEDGATCYGGITGFVLNGSTLEVTLSEEAAGILSLPVHQSIDLDVGAEDRESVKQAMDQVFASS